MKVSEIAEQLAKNPNTVFHMKHPDNYMGNTLGRIVEVTTTGIGGGRWNTHSRMTTAYKVEIREKDYYATSKYALKLVKPSKALLPQYIHAVYSDTQTLEETVVEYRLYHEGLVMEKAFRSERKKVFITYIANTVHGADAHTFVWQYAKLDEDTLEALAKALGYDARHMTRLDTDSIGDDSVMVGGN